MMRGERKISLQCLRSQFLVQLVRHLLVLSGEGPRLLLFYVVALEEG